MRLTFTLLLVIFYTQIKSQWYNVVRMADMPEPVSNNAIVEGWANDTGYVFSFGGIDSTKLWSGIHLRSFRYNTITNVWDTIPPLPDTLGKIAAAASWVDSIIYIIGGYHVYSNGNEASSNRVHRYDPRTNTYLSDGAPVPIPIDDHVQAVWNDSLIFVVTGWSNTGNVPDVQIYDPTNDNWLTGTPTPNNNSYKAFGASGTIVGNTIYYHGGAAYGFNFPCQSSLRIGQINPADPTQITWSISIPDPNIKTYRAGCTYGFGVVNWLGGSNTTYNYNGIAYNGSGGVEPLNQNYYTASGLSLDSALLAGEVIPMDLRGIANFSKDISFGSIYRYIAGGMETNQKVSKKTLRLEWMLMPGFNEYNTSSIKIHPNPTSNQIYLSFDNNQCKEIQLFDVLGSAIYHKNSCNLLEQIDLTIYPKGIYFVKVASEKESSTQKIIVQ